MSGTRREDRGKCNGGIYTGRPPGVNVLDKEASHGWDVLPARFQRVVPFRTHDQEM